MKKTNFKHLNILIFILSITASLLLLSKAFNYYKIDNINANALMKGYIVIFGKEFIAPNGLLIIAFILPIFAALINVFINNIATNIINVISYLLALLILLFAVDLYFTDEGYSWPFVGYKLELSFIGWLSFSLIVFSLLGSIISIFINKNIRKEDL